ncbi:MAG: bifunctional acetate--CoA ligase family protein/GNAT family N-acetyltransferase [Alphaproteobacteria bacterium]|nr:bifunctional acetate--CoA ligase family protein/GNAT family N-acetyltransferase [Alphaproteobacteria bacterium]
MTVRHLDKLFRPESVAVIGASNRPGAVGTVVMRNLLEGGFSGPIMPVNPKHKSVAGVLAYPDVDSLPEAPDLAVLCTPPNTVPTLISQLGERGTRAGVVLTAGLQRETDNKGRTLTEAMLAAAQPFGMRVLGPNCLGVLVPGAGLNASFAHLPARPGGIAFVSQSGAMCTAVLDWARAHDIGFSHFVSLGECADVEFGDVIDYLGSVPGTRAILLYIESIHERRNFMSATRAAARNKPVIVIKAGRVAEAARAAASHTGALAGTDDVFDAAIRRAGMLRVYDIQELFAAVETLARARRFDGERLAILTNGGGLGVMAVDDLIEKRGHLAELSKETIESLNQALPATWSGGNPVDIIGDAPGERYTKALDIIVKAAEVDAILIIHAPTAIASSTEAAQAIINIAKDNKKPILTSWVGEEAVAPARRMLNDGGIPTYDTPGQAVRAFMHMVDYHRNQTMLMETPPSSPSGFIPDTEAARRLVKAALPATGSRMMTEPDAKAVLAAYGIPVIETHVVATPAKAAEMAAGIGFPVALKILSPNISHKSDVGGVRLFLETPEAVEAAAEAMLTTIPVRQPSASLEGFTVQRMAERPGALELILGVATDPIFGPVILFGQGGIAVEVIGDRAVALPPLNMVLARELISRTRVSKLLRGYRDQPAADLDAICLTCMQISQLIEDIPEIVELDINPLFADENGVLALDARIGVALTVHDESRRLAIRPYPEELEEPFTLRSGREVLLRPIRPEDEPEHHTFISKLTPDDIRFRFFGLIHELPHTQMARYTQIDYDREMAFIASAPKDGGGRETLGVVRIFTDPDNQEAEFAIVVRSDLKGQGLGTKLMKKIIAYCRDRGTKAIVGQVLEENEAMRRLARSIGFKSKTILGEGIVEVTLPL